MKKYIGQKFFQIVMFILKWIDYRFTGSDSGMTDEEAIADPSKHYGQIRSRGTVLRSHRNRGWIVLGFDEVQSVLLDNRLGADLRKKRLCVEDDLSGGRW